MKIALTHDYLNQYGGAERVLESFCELFPDAPIYTLFYDKEKTYGKFEGREIKTSFLDSGIVNRNHKFFIPVMPMAASLMKTGDYDVVLSSSAGYAKGIKSRTAKHVVYCHTPLRYAWEYGRYFDNFIFNTLGAPAFECLKLWDYFAGRKPEVMLANSNFIANKIKNYYKRESQVLYPPVDLKTFYYDPLVRKQDYFLAVGRLIHYKKFDLIIKAFNELNLPLLIVGEGPEREALESKVKSQKSKVRFLPFVDAKDLRYLYASARALVFPQVEDFGLVAAEAQACGTPVIALNEGGGREIVENGKTGVLFDAQTAAGVKNAVREFLPLSFDPKIISASAERFSKEKFKEKILEIISETYKSRQ